MADVSYHASPIRPAQGVGAGNGPGGHQVSVEPQGGREFCSASAIVAQMTRMRNPGSGGYGAAASTQIQPYRSTIASKSVSASSMYDGG